MTKSPIKNIFLILTVMTIIAPQQVVAGEADSVLKMPAVHLHHELTIGYGEASSDQLFDGLQIGRPGNYRVQHYSGAISFSYKYFVLPQFAIGIAVAYENENGIWQQPYMQQTDEWLVTQLGSFKRAAFTPAIELMYIYKESKPVRYYCMAGIGFTYQNEVDIYSDGYYLTNYQNGLNSLGKNLQIQNNRYHFNGQITPIGISVGGRISEFMELGVGYKGILNIGITVKL